MLTADQTQTTCKPWQRRLAWTLIAALANPATVLPLSLYSAAASARDTDIYKSAMDAGNTAEPAVLLIVDTSDSMNEPEGWREYPGDYDSHVEYLWNDLTVIGSDNPYMKDDSDTTITAFPTDDKPVTVLKRYGSWAGSTLAERKALWAAASAYAKATYTKTTDSDADDPGPRYLYRNYNDANWIFWLPAGAAETDKRLWSNAFNRWKGGVRQSGSPADKRGGINYGATDNKYLDYNKCNDSLANLLPSTVFAPTDYPRNTGKYENQLWQRWEPFLGLRNGRLANNDTVYPTTLSAWTPNINSAAASITAAEGILSTSVNASIHARTQFLDSPPVRDSYPWVAPFPSYDDVAGQGQPIRTQITGASYSGWTDLVADMGGFNFQKFVSGSADVNQLYWALKQYDISSPIALDKAQHLAWKGNRDLLPEPAFGKMTGTPAYYDEPLTKLTLGIPDKPDPAKVCTRTCTINATPIAAANDATNSARWWVKSDASCQSVEPTCDPKPVPCTSPPAVNYRAAIYQGCKWSGRKSIPGEGTQTLYYGGTCSGSCYGEGNKLGEKACPNGPTSANYCWIDTSKAKDVKVNNTTYQNAIWDNGDNGSNYACNTFEGVYASCSSYEPAGTPGCFYVGAIEPCENKTAAPPVTFTKQTYDVYPFNKGQDYLVHDCQADNGKAGNPGNSVMTAEKRAFTTDWSDAVAYMPTGAKDIDPKKAVDMYSVNYLNWRFGPRGPNGKPIGRKTKLQIAKDSLTGVVNSTNGVRFGLMVYNKPSAANPFDTPGGHVVSAIRPMNTDNRKLLIDKLNSVVATGQTPLTEVMYEAYLYFRGEKPKFGTLQDAAASGGLVSDFYDPEAIKDGKYNSPILNNPKEGSAAMCQKNYVVLISDGGPESDNEADELVKALKQEPSEKPPLTTVQATTSKQFEDPTTGQPFGLPDQKYGTYVWLDELTYFMANGDMSPGGGSKTEKDLLPGIQTVSTYTIGFAGEGNTPVLKKAAEFGKGMNIEAKDSSDLSKALSDTLKAILAWHATAVAPTVSLSASNRNESAEDVYLAFFGPENRVRWDGTVKKFKFSTVNKECGITDGLPALCLTGQTDFGSDLRNIEELDPVTHMTTGNVRDDAVSFWIQPNKDGTFDADGGKPDKGGTGYVLKTASGSTPDSRQLYTYLSSNSEHDLTDASNAMSQANAAITAKLLGTADGDERAKVINFGRGGDNKDSGCSKAGTACSTWRTWPHADVLHSSPAILNYETNADEAKTVVYLFYMSNDGILHAVDTKTGQEKWAFMPEEALPQLGALMDDKEGEHLTAGDGSPKLFIKDGDGDGKIDNPDKDKAYLVFGLRRGGRALYALDIVDRAKPKLMWKIDNTKAEEGFAELGQTWSTPAFARLRATADPVLVFGGGYDPGSNDQLEEKADSMGRGVYFVNAKTSALIRSFTPAAASKTNVQVSGMDYSIPSDATPINTDLDSGDYADRLYIGDLGGNVWRFDIDNIDPEKWKAIKFADLTNGATPRRKIFFPPAVVKQYYGKRFDAVYVGTGDRENPLRTDNEDLMFMIKDENVGLTATDTSKWPISYTADNFADVTADLVDTGTEGPTGTKAAAVSEIKAKQGWVLRLRSSKEDPLGEKVVNAPRVFFNVLRFGTYTPGAQESASGTPSCLPPGKGTMYAINALNAGYAVDTDHNGTPDSRTFSGFPIRGFPSDGTIVIRDGKIWDLSGGGAGALNIEKIGKAGVGQRAYWFQEPEQ